jgi:putative DNA primase/helicase
MNVQMSDTPQAEINEENWAEWAENCSKNFNYVPSPGLLAMAQGASHAVPPAPRISASAKGSRGTRDSRDSFPHKDAVAPARTNEAGTTGANCEQRAHFELVEQSETRRTGVYWIGMNSDGSLQPPRWICSPLRIAAQTRDMRGGEWGRLLIFPDRDGREHRWAMPMRMLAAGGEELRAHLLAEGLTITSSKDRGRLADYIQNTQTDGKARCVNRTGWHDEVFVLPHETFGQANGETVLFQSVSLDGVVLTQAGALDSWRELVAKPCAGNSRLVLALCAAFAGPCLGLLGMDGGGIHFRGASSTGKSTALAVAASVYGPPAFLRTWRNTDNALEGVATLHSDLLLILDEIGQLDPRHAGLVAYMLAHGQGKGRAARDGSPRALTTWRVLFLSAGEIGLTDLVTESGGKVRAGQEVRVIDLPADAGMGLGVFNKLPEGIAPGALADALKSASASHYGHALPVLVRTLVADPERARTTLFRSRDAITLGLLRNRKAGQVRRVAERFAIVAAAGELATERGLTGWAAGEATRAAEACFAAWIDARGTDGASEPAAMMEQVRGFLSTHGESRFTAWNSDERSARTINRVGFRRDADGDFNAGQGGPTFYIERESFRTEVCKGFDHRAVAKVLASSGALLLESDGGSTRSERLPDGRKARVYVVTPALWDVE